MKITFLTGSTATKVGEKKPQRFYGGDTEDIVDKQAEAALAEGIALKAGTKEAKEFARTVKIDPRTRNQRLDTKTPGLEQRLAAKRAVTEALQGAGKKAATGGRSKADLLGEGLNGPKKEPDGKD